MPVVNLARGVYPYTGSTIDIKFTHLKWVQLENQFMCKTYHLSRYIFEIYEWSSECILK
jgi:hypothetical protein